MTAAAAAPLLVDVDHYDDAVVETWQATDGHRTYTVRCENPACADFEETPESKADAVDEATSHWCADQPAPSAVYAAAMRRHLR